MEPILYTYQVVLGPLKYLQRRIEPFTFSLIAEFANTPSARIKIIIIPMRIMYTSPTYIMYIIIYCIQFYITIIVVCCIELTRITFMYYIVRER